MVTYLHRFNVKPGHLDGYLPLWQVEAEIRRRHGFRLHQAYLETHAEPELTWLYSHDYTITPARALLLGESAA